MSIAFPPSKPFSLSNPGETYGNPGAYSSFLRDVLESSFEIGGIHCHIYRLEGAFEQTRDELGTFNDEAQTPKDGTNIDTVFSVQDVVLGEIRDRKYNLDEVPVVKGVYQVSDSEMEFLRFGFKSNETLSVEFHQAQIERALGRRLLEGDVVEMPHLRETGLDGRSANKWYEVKSITWSPSGYDPMFQKHVIGVIMHPLRHQQEFLDIFNNVTDEYGKTLAEQSSNEKQVMAVTEAIQEKAKEQVPVIGVDTTIMWFDPEQPNKVPVLWSTESTRPSNLREVEQGIAFPENPEEGTWFLRIDSLPNRLYQYANRKWNVRAIDENREWQPYNWVSKLREHMSDRSEEDRSRGYELRSIHDVLTPREKLSDPSGEKE